MESQLGGQFDDPQFLGLRRNIRSYFNKIPLA